MCAPVFDSTRELSVPCYLYWHWALGLALHSCVSCHLWSFGFGLLLLGRPAGPPGPLGFVLWAPGSVCLVVVAGAASCTSCRVRGPSNSVHPLIRCTSTPQECDPVALVLERMRVVAGKKWWLASAVPACLTENGCAPTELKPG